MHHNLLVYFKKMINALIRDSKFEFVNKYCYLSTNTAICQQILQFVNKYRYLSMNIAICHQILLFVNQLCYMSRNTAICQQIVLYVNKYCYLSTRQSLVDNSYVMLTFSCKWAVLNFLNVIYSYKQMSSVTIEQLKNFFMNYFPTF